MLFDLFASQDDEDYSNDDSNDISDDEDDDSEIDGELGELVQNLAPEIRNKVLNKTPIDSDSDEDDSDDDEAGKLTKWGKKKSYYDGDTADLEIGQEFDDAKEEEKAAKEIVKEKMSRMKAADFFDDVGDDYDDNDNMEAYIKKNSTKNARKHDKVIGDLEAIALDSAKASIVKEQHSLLFLLLCGIHAVQ